MTEREWELSRELLQARLALYEAQNAFLGLAAEKARSELQELGDSWAASGEPLQTPLTPPRPEPTAAP